METGWTLPDLGPSRRTVSPPGPLKVSSKKTLLEMFLCSQYILGGYFSAAPLLEFGI